MVTRDLVQITNHVQVEQVCIVMIIQKYHNYEAQENLLTCCQFLLFFANGGDIESISQIKHSLAESLFSQMYSNRKSTKKTTYFIVTA